MERDIGIEDILMNSDNEEENIEDIDDISMEFYDSSSDDDEEPDIQPSAKRSREESRMWNNSTFTPTLHDFDGFQSGLKANLNVQGDYVELELFQLFFTDDVVDVIVRETNIYAAAVSQKTPESSKMKKWVNTTAQEIFVFLATIILMSLVGKNCIKKYWTNNALIETPFFKVLFSQDRFLLILRNLHFTSLCSSNDRLYKIRQILDPLRKIMKETFSPHQNLCIDESLLLWKGRLSFKVYIPSKRHRFGIKFFVCCDVKTGYVLDLIIYTGAETDIQIHSDVGISGSVVLCLLKDYLDRGHRLYVDNWYTSPALFDCLFDRKTNACGTARVNRKQMPKFEKIKKGDVVAFNSANLMALKWRDKRDVVILTTMHTDTMIETPKIDYSTGLNKHKPEAVVDYTKNMGSVDNVDRILGLGAVGRKTVKWYKKVFFRLLEISIVNAFFLFRTVKCKNTYFEDFKEKLVAQIVEKYHTPRAPTSGGRRANDNPIRLTERHFIQPVPQTQVKGSTT